MKQRSLGIMAFLTLVLLMSFTFPSVNDGQKTPNLQDSSKAQSGTESKGVVKWYTLEEASKLVQSNPKKVLVDIYTDWCGWCKRMDKDTFQHPQIAKYLNENFYPVKLNAEQKGDINIYGTTFSHVPSSKGRGYHEAAVMLMKGQSGYPTVVFLNEKLQPITVAPGYQDPIDMDQMMRFINEGHLEEGISFNIFKRNFRSRIKMDK